VYVFNILIYLMDIKKIIASIIWRRDCVIYPEEIFYENKIVESMSFDNDSDMAFNKELNCNVLRDISNNEINICEGESESDNKKNNFEKEKENAKVKCTDFVLSNNIGKNNLNFDLKYIPWNSEYAEYHQESQGRL
jgi:hypothetical protein